MPRFSFLPSTPQEDQSAKRRSLLLTALCSLLLLLAIFFMHIRWEQPQDTQYIAVNFGNTDLGDGPAEPQEAASAASSAAPQTAEPTPQTTEPLITDEQSEASLAASPKKQEEKKVETPKKQNPKPQPQKTNPQSTTQKSEGQNTNQTPAAKPSDGRGRAALGNLLGGKGTANSTGQGSGGVGNAGDPTGQNSFGNGGRKLVSKIPEPQFHDCPESGTMKVEYVLDKSGRVKSAKIGRGSTSNDPCLQQRAIELVKKYVRGNEGVDNDGSVYTVKLE